MKTSIVIPFYNQYHLLHQLLFDLYSHGNRPDEVIVVNDASDDKEVYDGLGWWKSNGMLKIVEKRNEENLGFLYSANIGITSSKGDIVILISNDVRVRCDLVSIVLEKLRPEMLIGGRLLDYDTGWNVFSGKVYPYLEGWLLACYQEGWDELGCFDTRFAPSDYEDIDLSTKAKDHGYSLLALNDDRITHIGGQSYKYDEVRRERTERNREVFRDKWLK